MSDVECKNVDNKLVITKASSVLYKYDLTKYFLKNNIKYLDLCDGIEYIDESVFSYNNMIDVHLPNSLIGIGNGSFYECTNLKKIIIPRNLLSIGNKAFKGCSNLESITFSNSLKEIGEKCFDGCTRLKKIELPNSIEKIKSCAFFYCTDLESVIIPNSLLKLGASAFAFCDSLKDVKLSNNLKEIPNSSFCYCKSLEKIEIPEGVEKICSNAFQGCISLKEVYIPNSLKYFDSHIFEDCLNLEKLIFNINGKKVEVDVKGARFIQCFDGTLFWCKDESGEYGFYKEGKVVKFSKNQLLNNKGIKGIIDGKMTIEEDYIKLYFWIKKKFVPPFSIISIMPIRDVDNFYVNNNCKEWAKLLKESKIKEERNKSAFFKLCYVLGVFNEKESIRDRAVEFIRNNIIDKLSEDEVYARFNGFNINNGYNDEYAKFFMKYYNIADFMIFVNDNGQKIDLMSASYNNFNNVKKYYPNKLLNTNRKVDVLLPKHVIKAIYSVEYENVDEGNDELAKMTGLYCYSQEQFEVIQKLFNKGKSIKEGDIKLFIGDDNKEKMRYSLLEKDNPLGAVLGNITNCCQVIGGLGESCVKYGMTQPNSKFMIFNYNDTIIGQSWVWYDEESKTVCLDDIEVPARFTYMIKHNEKMQKEFLNCLKRLSRNFIDEMENHGIEVEYVTIGKGYNKDIINVLEKEFKLSEYPVQLSDYSEYSDSEEQYILSNKK